MALVSIILPVFNHSEYIADRIKSIIDQSFQDFEILLYDDCSTDGSQDVIKSFLPHPQIAHVHFASSNSGSPFGSWKDALEKAKGKYIWIAESDDLCSPNFLADHVKVLEENTSVLVSYSSSKWISENSDVTHEPHHENSPLQVESHDALVNYLTKGPMIYNMSSAVIRKSAIPTLDFEHLKNYKYTGDWYFWVQLLQEKGVVNRLANRANFFRRHSENVSFAAEEAGLRFKEGLPIVRDILKNTTPTFIQKLRIKFYWSLQLLSLNKTQALRHLKTLSNFPFLWWILARFYSSIKK